MREIRCAAGAVPYFGDVSYDPDGLTDDPGEAEGKAGWWSGGVWGGGTAAAQAGVGGWGARVVAGEGTHMNTCQEGEMPCGTAMRVCA